jgi:hypothetical protein
VDPVSKLFAISKPVQLTFSEVEDLYEKKVKVNVKEPRKIRKAMTILRFLSNFLMSEKK